MSNQKVYIYALSETGDDNVRYVGQTISPGTRLAAHFNTDTLVEENPKRQWIEDVKQRGQSIEMEIIDECRVDEAVKHEQKWINHYRENGHDLTNTAKATRAPRLTTENKEVSPIGVLKSDPILKNAPKGSVELLYAFLTGVKDSTEVIDGFSLRDQILFYLCHASGLGEVFVDVINKHMEKEYEIKGICPDCGRLRSECPKCQRSDAGAVDVIGSGTGCRL